LTISPARVVNTEMADILNRTHVLNCCPTRQQRQPKGNIKLVFCQFIFVSINKYIGQTHGL